MSLTPTTRIAVYVVTALLTPVFAYLLAKDVIGELEMGLWSAEVAVVNSMAAFHVGRSGRRDHEGELS